MIRELSNKRTIVVICIAFFFCPLGGCLEALDKSGGEAKEEISEVRSFAEIDWQAGDTIIHARPIHLRAQLGAQWADLPLDQIPRTAFVVKDPSGRVHAQSNLRFMVEYGVHLYVADYYSELKAHIGLGEETLVETIAIAGNSATLTISLAGLGGER